MDGNPIRVCEDCLAVTLSGWSDHTTSKGWETRLRSKYGLDAGEHGRMFIEQSGVCAICRDPARSARGDTHNSGLVVDHDHFTGKVRGLLCARCNVAIGLLADNDNWTMAAAYYLRRHNRQQNVRVKRRKEKQKITEEHIARRKAEMKEKRETMQKPA